MEWDFDQDDQIYASVGKITAKCSEVMKKCSEENMAGLCRYDSLNLLNGAGETAWMECGRFVRTAEV